MSIPPGAHYTRYGSNVSGNTSTPNPGVCGKLQRPSANGISSRTIAVRNGFSLRSHSMSLRSLVSVKGCRGRAA